MIGGEFDGLNNDDICGATVSFRNRTDVTVRQRCLPEIHVALCAVWDQRECEAASRTAGGRWLALDQNDSQCAPHRAEVPLSQSAV